LKPRRTTVLISFTQDSVDYVVHLGDYIYEYENGYYGWGDSLGRIPLPNKEIYSLYDYRKRLATYRTDLDLVASHQQFAWIGTQPTHALLCPYHTNFGQYVNPKMVLATQLNYPKNRC
jgi:phosphodiesterase/alkaline phosphatase D-like protein